MWNLLSRHRVRYLIIAFLVMILIVWGLFAFSDFLKHSNPKKVVHGYLNALANDNANDALSYNNESDLYRSASSKAFLTDKVLAASEAIAPMKVISVGDAQITPNPDHTTSLFPTATASVNATYSFGSHKTTHTFTLVQFHKKWYIDYAYDIVDIHNNNDSYWADDAGAAAVGLTLNGVPLHSSTIDVALFPGSYQFGTTNPLTTVTGGSFIIDGAPPLDTEQTLYGDGIGSSTNITTPGSLVLTTQAQARIGQLAQTKFNDCLAKPNALNTCVFLAGTIPDTYDESSIRWQMTRRPGGVITPFDMSTWQWQIINGTGVPTGTAFDKDIQSYMATIASGKMTDGTSIDPLKAKYFTALLPSIACADISDPNNIQISFPNKIYCGTL